MAVWSDNIAQFDELYSVSDLHVGGLGSGAQIFDSGRDLAKLIDYLRTKPRVISLRTIRADFITVTPVSKFSVHTGPKYGGQAAKIFYVSWR